MSTALLVEELEKHAPKLTAEGRKKTAEAYQLLEAVRDGSARARVRFEEQMVSGDFPKLLAAAFGTKLLAKYQSIEPTWNGYATRETVPDFNAQKWVDVLGGQGELSLVAEGAPYPQRKVAETDGSYRVYKYGDTFQLTWEMYKNDRLGAFMDLPEKLAQSAREQEDRVATMQLTDGSGPNATLFSSTSAKGLAGAAGTTIVTSNPALSETSLGTALGEIGVRVDYDGRPVILRGAVLVVPPQLANTANRIVQATEYREVVSGNTIVRTNPFAGVVTVVVNPWLNALDAGSNKATNWFVLPDPNSTPKPAIVVAFLAGNETPDLRYKNDQGVSLSGGSLGAEEGSFEFDSIDYRVRHVVGAGSVDANQVAYSEGDGS